MIQQQAKSKTNRERRGYGIQAPHCCEAVQTWTSFGRRAVVTALAIPMPTHASTAQLTLTPELDVLTVSPSDKTAALAACKATLESHGYWGGGRLRIETKVTVGKGMGSSTADVASAIRAAFDALALPAPESTELLRLLKQSGEAGVDSTIMGESAAIMATREFRVIRNIGVPFPHLVALAIDAEPAREVRTADFYRIPPMDEFTLAKGNFLIDTLARAIVTGDFAKLTKTMEASALEGQKEVFNPCLEDVIELAHTTKGAAFRAHTGTITGVAWPANTPNLDALMKRAKNGLASLEVGAPFPFSTRILQESQSNEVNPLADAA